MGARGRACPICASEATLLQRINSLLESGEGPTSISRLTGIPKDRIGRHKKHAFQPAAVSDALGDPGSELEMSDARLARWLGRSEAAWVAASAQGDTKAAIDALRSGVRSELEHRRRLEKREEQASTGNASLLPNGQKLLSVDALDKLVREHREACAKRGRASLSAVRNGLCFKNKYYRPTTVIT